MMTGLIFALTLIPVATLLTVFLEQYLKPLKPKLSFQYLRMQLTGNGVIFILFLLILRRPVFSLAIILVCCLVFIIVNNAKYNALKEPMIFSDIAMFSQVFTHPRLYLPFLGWLPLILVPVISIAAITLFFMYETALSFNAWQYLSLILLLIALIWVYREEQKQLIFTLNPENDIKTFGLFHSLVGYALKARQQTHKTCVQTAIAASPFNKQPPLQHPGAAKLPNIIAIQSESFFDVRRLSKDIPKNCLDSYDTISLQSTLSGELEVPAWGANTMRTEYAFLSGLDLTTLQYYQFYPYQYLRKFNHFSIANYLNSLGYECICIHPHEASFFGRDKLFKQLGFSRFIDIHDFDSNDTFGPYQADASVTRKIIKTLEKRTDKPLFIFVITMENHGPLHLEKTSQQEREHYLGKKLVNKHPGSLNDLAVYIRHLNNADKMIKELSDYLNSTETESYLAFYGDHIPSMPKIYKCLGFAENTANYFLWANQQQKAQTRRIDSNNSDQSGLHNKSIGSDTFDINMPIKELSLKLLRQAKII